MSEIDVDAAIQYHNERMRAAGIEPPPYTPPERCAVCSTAIETMTFRGTGACSDGHLKLIYGTGNVSALTHSQRTELLDSARVRYNKQTNSVPTGGFASPGGRKGGH